MSKIKVMDEILANKIAAGEVVEKCASVVKELVENSIDALSDEIEIMLIDSGTKMIKVTDNGIGMNKEDATLAFSRHATSKIEDEDDLFHIETLGFRGEALAAISSVSNIVLKTSTGTIGTEIHLNGGRIKEIKNSSSRKGTSIEVNDLFYNTPARLKHMRSLYTELANITDYVNKLALSFPNIRFTLINNEKVLLKTDGSSNLLKTIQAVYGVNIAKKMIKIKGNNDDYSVEGYISLPEVHRSNKNNMVTLVNNRVVRNMELNRIINDSYHSYKPDNRYPVVVLNITVDPTIVDVNIHPTKMDIKLSKLDELTSLIERMIKKALKERILIPQVEIKSEQIYQKPNYEELTIDLNRVAETEENYDKFDNTEELIINDELILDEELVMNDELDNEIIEKKDLPELYIVGVVHGTYIICQNELGMYLIDQHAAKERINYEFYKEKLGNPPKEKTSLLFPITLEFSNNEFIILKENFDILKNLGFDISEFGINSIIIKAHPTWLPTGYEEEIIKKIIEIILEKENNFSLVKFNEAVATMMSCKLAIKANESISTEELEYMINDLRKCDNPYNCPHGRPTIIFYSNYDLEKLFKRSGF